MSKNKSSLSLLKRDLIRCVAVILCLVIVIIPIYLKCSEVVYDNLQDKLERDVAFGAELMEKEIDAQNIMIAKLKISPQYNVLRKKDDSFSPEENVIFNEMQQYYNDFCSAFFLQERTILFFNKNHIMLDKNSITPYAMDSYGYSWSVDTMTYDEFKAFLFERNYHGEFPVQLKMNSSGGSRLMYLKTIGNLSGNENSVMVSIFNFEDIITQCGLEEILKSGNVYLKNSSGEVLESIEKTKKTAMTVEHQFSALPISITAEVSEEYVSGQMAGIRRVILIYFILMFLAVALVALIYAYQHWKMVSEIAEFFGKEEEINAGKLTIDHNLIRQHRSKMDIQRKQLDELMTEKLFTNLLNNTVNPEELAMLEETWLASATGFCLMMIKLETSEPSVFEEVISRLYSGHINIILSAKTEPDRIVMLLDAQALNIAELKKLTHDMIYNDGISIRAVVSGVKEQLKDIADLVHQMRNVLTYLETSSFVQMDEIKRDTEYDSYISFEYTKQLYDHIMNGNMRLAVRHVYEQWYHLSENPSIDDEVSKLFYWQYGVVAQIAAELGYKGKLPALGYGRNIVEIAQEVIGIVEKLCALASEKNNVGVNRSEQIIRYIEERCYDSQFYMIDLCDKFGLSERTVGEIIKNETGMRFSDYVGELRIKRVEQLLSTTDISINDIATMCGFASNNALYKAFKRVHTLSPTQFRADTNDAKLKMEEKDVF